MAIQPVDRQKFKQDARTLKRNIPVMVRRSNKLIIECIGSTHGPQVTDGFRRYWRSQSKWWQEVYAEIETREQEY